MKKIAKNIWLSLSAIRLFPHILYIKYHSSKEVIALDLERWSVESFNGIKPETGFDYIWAFVKLMTFLPEYRNLFYYRTGWTSKILYSLCRPMPLLSIGFAEEGIGPGLIIKHGRASGIVTRKIGKNCMVFQHVSIGYSNPNDKPTLGDNVIVFAGAKIMGDVKIGNNSIIGANAVVVKNVPENCTVVGVPAYIVRQNGMKMKKPL